jgi:hypothetical protein
MIAHIVRGDTGIYSDFRFWDVAAFSDSDRAKDLCFQLNEWCRENKLTRNDPWIPYDKRPTTCPFDPQFEYDADGTSYEVWSIEVRE